jgi:hypothetical protein
MTITDEMLQACRSALLDYLEDMTSTAFAVRSEARTKCLRAILEAAERAAWQPIATYDPKAHGHILCCHDTKHWTRFGICFPEVPGRWYYSGTSERSQYAQVEGDAPTHFRAMPTLPQDPAS